MDLPVPQVPWSDLPQQAMAPSTSPLLEHHRTSNLCESTCGITVAHDGHRVHAIRGDGRDTFSGGNVCPKVMALKNLHEDPDRQQRPMLRGNDGWKTIASEEAIDRVATQLRRIRRRVGGHACDLGEVVGGDGSRLSNNAPPCLLFSQDMAMDRCLKYQPMCVS